MLRILAQVPFTEHAGRVTCFLERLSDGDFIQWKLYHIVHRSKRTAPPVKTVDVPHCIYSRPRHVLPAHESGAGGLAIRSSGLAAAKTDALLSQTIDVRSFVILAAVRTD